MSNNEFEILKCTLPLSLWFQNFFQNALIILEKQSLLLINLHLESFTSALSGTPHLLLEAKLPTPTHKMVLKVLPLPIRVREVKSWYFMGQVER